MCFPSYKKSSRLLTTCLLNGRRQRETAIYQQNRQQYVSVHADENSQWSSSSYCWTTWEMYKRGAFDQITNAIQMSLQMLSSQLLFGIKCILWLLSAVCLQQIPQQTSPHAKHWPVNSPWRLQKQKVKIDFLWHCYLYLAVSDCNYRPPNPILTWPEEWNCGSHTRREIWAAISHNSYLEKAQKASLLLVVSSLAKWWRPHSISLFSLLLLSGTLDIYAGENYYFSISRSTQKRKKASPTCPGPTHLFSTLFFSTLFSPRVTPLIPPHLPFFFLPHSFPSLYVSL